MADLTVAWLLIVVSLFWIGLNQWSQSRAKKVRRAAYDAHIQRVRDEENRRTLAYIAETDAQVMGRLGRQSGEVS